MTLRELQAKLEAASEPSRELDVWIRGKLDFAAPQPFTFGGVEFATGTPEPWTDDDIDYVVKTPDAEHIQPYTASLDAALALARRLIPGCAVTLHDSPDGCDAEVSLDNMARASAPPGMPALALCKALVALVDAQEPADAG